MRGNASRFADKQIGAAQAKAGLVALLTNCTDANLAAFTVDGLTRMYRVDAKTVEYELTIARQRREAR